MGVIRGAICCENTEKDISDKSVELLKIILQKNNLKCSDVDAVFFSATSDLDACYPAKSAREHFGMSNVAFMCFSEMRVEGSLDHCLRVAVFSSKLQQRDCRHCFVGKASYLRSDLP